MSVSTKSKKVESESKLTRWNMSRWRWVRPIFR